MIQATGLAYYRSIICGLHEDNLSCINAFVIQQGSAVGGNEYLSPVFGAFLHLANQIMNLANDILIQG